MTRESRGKESPAGESFGPAPVYPSMDTEHRPSPDDLHPRLRRVFDRILDAHASGADRILLTANRGNGAISAACRVAAALDGSTSAARNGRAVLRLAGLAGPAVNECEAPAPLRAPYHTVSVAGLIGGGSLHGMPRPGEVSLAHGGVLLLDEWTEFARGAQQALLHTLDRGTARFERTGGTWAYPARPALVIAVRTPCPCGYLGHPDRACTDAPRAVARHLDRGALPGAVEIGIPAPPAQSDFLAEFAQAAD